MKQWLKKLWLELKPQNGQEIVMRIIGIASVITAILVVKENIVLNIFGQSVWIAMVAAICLVCTYSRKEIK